MCLDSGSGYVTLQYVQMMNASYAVSVCVSTLGAKLKRDRHDRSCALACRLARAGGRESVLVRAKSCNKLSRPHLVFTAADAGVAAYLINSADDVLGNANRAWIMDERGRSRANHR